MASTHAIARVVLAGEEELAAKLLELAHLTEVLIERKVRLVDLKSELATFENAYLRRIGVLYAELDDWAAKVAEALASKSAYPEARRTAADARSKAEQTRAAAFGTVAEEGRDSPSPELKALYRQVVNRVHPDRSVDEADRIRRHHFMAEANRAYRNRDKETLTSILEQYRLRPELTFADAVCSDLERIGEQIEKIVTRIASLDAQIAALADSDLARLMVKVQVAAEDGRDLLSEMASDVRTKIDEKRAELDFITNLEVSEYPA